MYRNVGFGIVPLAAPQTHQPLPGISLDQQLTVFLAKIGMTEALKRSMEAAIQDLKSLLGQTYRNGVVIPFGSFVTGLGDEESDVDIFIDAHGTSGISANVVNSLSYEMSIYSAVSQILRKSPTSFSGIEEISGKVRVPIIKATHVRTGIRMDLSFQGILGRRKSELISLLVQWSPVVRPLFLVLRHWAKSNGILGSKKLKNYALTLLVFVFLTRRRIIPSVHWIQERSTPVLVDHVWNAGFCNDVNRLKGCPGAGLYVDATAAVNAKMILSLAHEFFNMFATLDYSNLVICTLTGEFIPKSAFVGVSLNSLPVEQQAYKNWIARNMARKYQLYHQRPMCIQDPINLSHNVSDVVDPWVLTKFKESCAKTADRFRKVLTTGQAQLLTHIFGVV